MPFRFLVTVYFSCLAVGCLTWIAANTWTDPSLADGLSFGSIVINYLLFGVNGWFLRALLHQIAVARDANQIALQMYESTTAPYLWPDVSRWTSGELPLRNDGAGVARRATAYLFEKVEDEANLYLASTSAIASLAETVARPRFQRRINLSLPVHPICVLSCHDGQGRQHVRGFAADGELGAFTLVPPGAASGAIGIHLPDPVVSEVMRVIYELEAAGDSG